MSQKTVMDKSQLAGYCRMATWGAIVCPDHIKTKHINSSTKAMSICFWLYRPCWRLYLNLNQQKQQLWFVMFVCLIIFWQVSDNETSGPSKKSLWFWCFPTMLAVTEWFHSRRTDWQLKDTIPADYQIRLHLLQDQHNSNIPKAEQGQFIKPH